jgi:sedoheptulokinase
MDFIVAMFTNSDIVKTSDQLAASWGFFHTAKAEWNLDVLAAAGFPVDMLPQVVASGNEAGVLSDSWFDIPARIPVGVALGDLQCSIRATLIKAETDAVLNVSTSAQMAFVKRPGFTPPDHVILITNIRHAITRISGPPFYSG